MNNHGAHIHDYYRERCDAHENRECIFVMKYSVSLFLWSILTGFLAGFGVTGGVHRYWTHKTYKANLPLRIFLMICFSIAGQKGKQLDMSDVLADPVVQFSQRHFVPLKLLCCFIIPTLVPVLWWGENWYNSFLSQGVIRYIFSLNATWSVNSAAHIWGYKPYDIRIKPTENIVVSLVALGEGWHNYHHVFPWDYKAAELGTKINLTTYLLDLFAKIGWAWDMKQPSKELEVAEEEDLQYRYPSTTATADVKDS
ncbi:uncharacterized protein CBL_12211 [Carabus blaptoides fortunei]